MKTAVRTIAAALLFSLTLTACGGDPTPTTTEPDAISVPPADAIDVTIEGVDIANDEVTVRGQKPTPCNALGSIVSARQDTIEIEIWAEPSDEPCTQVIDPFEVSFTLPQVESETAVRLNGEEIGRIGG